MGLLDMRKRKIAENAKEHMEPGEEVRELAMTQTKSPNISLAQQLRSTVIAVAASDRNLYALMIHPIRPTKVVGAESWPLGEVRLAHDNGTLVINDDVRLSVLTGAGKDAKKLVEYVSSSRAA